MVDIDSLLGGIPKGLRAPLIKEYKKLSHNYMEHRWEAAELSAGKICEIVYTIIKGRADGNYPRTPTKPRNMVEACRALESNSHLPRSLKILIPRLIPGLYEIRNNRGVGHVGSDVNPNDMDAALAFSIVNWMIAELIRVFYAGDIEDAQRVIRALSERRTPLIWDNNDIKKVLSPNMPLKEQILVLCSSTTDEIDLNTLMKWTESTNKTYYKRLLKAIHKDKLVHFDESKNTVVLLPLGSNRVIEIIEEYT